MTSESKANIFFLIVLGLTLALLAVAYRLPVQRHQPAERHAWMEGYMYGLNVGSFIFAEAVTNRPWDGRLVEQAIYAGTNHCPYPQ